MGCPPADTKLLNVGFTVIQMSLILRYTRSASKLATEPVSTSASVSIPLKRRGILSSLTLSDPIHGIVTDPVELFVVAWVDAWSEVGAEGRFSVEVKSGGSLVVISLPLLVASNILYCNGPSFCT